jgi:hypothetical protein
MGLRARHARTSDELEEAHGERETALEYTVYLREIDRAAEATGGGVVSLAGGYFGVELMADGARLVLALDLDSDQGWVVWSEDRDGERCCDRGEEVIGHCPLDELRDRSLLAIAGHVHG